MNPLPANKGPVHILQLVVCELIEHLTSILYSSTLWAWGTTQWTIIILTAHPIINLMQVFFKENVRYPMWTCRDPISLILGIRFL